MTTSSYTAADRGSLDDHIASFLTELTAAGYAPHRRAQRRSIVYAFKDWLQARRIAAADVSETHLAAFVRRRR